MSCLTAHDVQVPSRRVDLSADMENPKKHELQRENDVTVQVKPTIRSMNSVDVVRRLAGVHQRVHSSKTASALARKTPEGIGNASEGGQTRDQAGIKAHLRRHGRDR